MFFQGFVPEEAFAHSAIGICERGVRCDRGCCDVRVYFQLHRDRRHRIDELRAADEAAAGG